MPATDDRRARDVGLVGLGALALAVAMTWPLALHPASVVPNDVGDPLLNTWILRWNASVVPLTRAWWNAPIFFPATGTMAFSEHLLGLWPLASPVYWVSGSPLLAYNVTFLSTFVFSAMAAFLLGREITGRADAAVVCALAYAFAPYRISQLAHLQVLASFWMPFALFCAHRYLGGGGGGGGRLWLVAFGGAFVAQAMSNGYYLVFFPVLLAWWSLWHIRRNTWRRVIGLAMSGLAGVLVLLPLLLTYRDVHARYNLTRSPLAAQQYAADAAGWLEASPLLALWGRLNLAPTPEGQLFTGVAVVAVALLGIIAVTRRASAPAWPPGSRTTFACYGVGAIVMYAFALGPAPAWFGEPWLSLGPYAWLMQVPGVEALRVPARFAMLTALCLAAASAIAFACLTNAWRGSRRRVAAVVLGAAVVAEGWPAQVPLWEPPSPWHITANEVRGALLVLPIVNAANEVAAMYRAIPHGRPLVNGYSGHRPPWYEPIYDGVSARDPAVFDALFQAGVTHVAIVSRQDKQGIWSAYVKTRCDLVRLADDGAYALYAIRGTADARPVHDGPALPIAGLDASVMAGMLPAMIDDSPETFWFTRVGQTGGERLVINLGAVREVEAVELALGRHHNDRPRELLIEVSADGVTWNEVWRGGTVEAVLTAAFRAPALIPMQFGFSPRPARLVRLTQTGRSHEANWTVVNLRVIGPS